MGAEESMTERGTDQRVSDEVRGDGKFIAVITGASKGIGRAIAVRLAPKYHVVAVARTAPELESLAREIEAKGGRCTPLVLDVTDFEAIPAALGGVEADVLVNNAGVGVMKPVAELTPAEWHRMLDVNVNALFHVTRAVLPGMIARGRGHVVNVSSIAGRSAFVGGAGYAATKHFVNGFSESLMLEVRDHGVRVSVVSPGSVATGFSSGADAPWKLRPEQVAESVAHVLDAPPGALVYSVEVRAAQPPARR